MFDAHGHAIRLTQEQTGVVDHGSGPALVVSGAGSGKTTVLLMRVRRLIAAGVDPRAIGMLTFSRRGAEDMRRRSVRLGVPSGVQYRTLHSIAWGAIKDAAAVRIPEVPKTWQVVRVMKDELKKIRTKLSYRHRGLMPKPREVLHEIGLAKAHMVWPDEIDYDTGEILRSGRWESPVLGKEMDSYFEWATTRDREPLDTRTGRIFERCYATLEKASRNPESAGFDRDAGLRWVTYDDMVALVGRGILTCSGWVRPWYSWKPIILIDEVQDNAPVNWVTCEYLAGPDRHVMAVGDDMQSIFGFRGSDPGLMQEFLARHGDAKVYHLTTNFRSGSTLLSPMNRVVASAPDTLSKGLVCGTGRVGMVSVVSHLTSSAEAQSVVQDIVQSIGDGVDPDEIAVLYRINASSGPLEMQLIVEGVPYRVAGSSFFNRGEIKAAIGYLGCALDGGDAVGWKGCANAPTRWLGSRFFDTCPTMEAARNGLLEGNLGRWKRGARAAITVVGRVRSLLVDRGSIRMALMYVFDEAGVRAHFKDEGAQEEDDTDVDAACDALVACATSLCTGVRMRQGDLEEPKSKSELAKLAAGELVRFAREMTSTGMEDYSGDRGAIPRVTLSTIHKAKGLEWDRVHVIGNNPGLFPLGDAPLAEERRLFYVAGTRARNVCVFSHAEMSPMEQVLSPSPFLVEAGLLPSVEEKEFEDKRAEEMCAF